MEAHFQEPGGLTWAEQACSHGLLRWSRGWSRKLPTRALTWKENMLKGRNATVGSHWWCNDGAEEQRIRTAQQEENPFAEGWVGGSV